MSESVSNPVASLPNHEELPYALRAVEGSLPSFAPLLLFIGLLVIGGLQEPHNIALMVLLALLGTIFFAAGAYGIFWLRRRTPTSVTIDGSGVTGVWGQPARRQLRVGFGQITSLHSASWSWIHAGRAVYCRFTPPTISYETMGMAGNPLDHMFVTEQVRHRVSQAREAWMTASLHGADSPLQSDEMTEQQARDLGEV